MTAPAGSQVASPYVVAHGEPTPIQSDREDFEHRAATAVQGLRLLSTLPFEKSTFWSRSVETLAANEAGSGWFHRLCSRFGIHDPALIGRLLRRAHGVDAILLNGGERTDLIYLAFAGLMPWIHTPHLIVDAHWQPGSSRGHLWAQRTLLRMARRLIAEVQIHSDEEVDLYERNFGVLRDVLRPLPWSTSLSGYEIRRAAGPGEANILTRLLFVSLARIQKSNFDN